MGKVYIYQSPTKHYTLKNTAFLMPLSSPLLILYTFINKIICRSKVLIRSLIYHLFYNVHSGDSVHNCWVCCDYPLNCHDNQHSWNTWRAAQNDTFKCISLKKSSIFFFKFHWSSFLWVPLTIIRDWIKFVPMGPTDSYSFIHATWHH